MGNVVIADTANYRIRVAAASTGTFYSQPMTAGDIYTVAGNGTPGYSGDGGPATKAEVQTPEGVAVDSAGDLLIADTGNMRVRMVAAATGTFYGQPMTAGDIYTVAGNGTEGYTGDGGLATKAQLSFPNGVAVDGAGNVVIADAGNNVVRVVAARAGRFYGQAMKAGHIYTVAGNGTSGYSGDGGPATSAELSDPAGVAVDASGNLVIADTFNDAVRVVAGSTGTFYGQAMTAGDIYTVAGNGTPGFSGDGGPATNAELFEPGGVGVDGSGQHADRRHPERPDPGGSGEHGHVLRPGDDRRGHLHRGRQRHGGILRRRRPGHQRRTPRAVRGSCRRRRRPGHRRQRQQPDPLTERQPPSAGTSRHLFTAGAMSFGPIAGMY